MGSENRLVRIDGRYGEGGGSIVRVAAGLSAVTGRPIAISNIREGRPRPGLAAQHLTGLKALARLCNARIDGVELGSTAIKFVPSKPSLAELSVDAGTAGSIGLMLQGLMIALPFAGREVRLSLTGGTHVSWSPNFDYLRNITIPVLGSMGYRCDVTMLAPGYYPRGGGKVSFVSRPCDHLAPLRMDAFGDLVAVEGISRASNLPEHVAARQSRSAAEALSGTAEPSITVSVERSLSTGSAITLWATTTTGCRLGASALGERGKPAETVGRQAGEEMRGYLQRRASVDPHLLDQMLPYCALARGASVLRGFELTMHTTTNIHVVQLFLECSIQVEGKVGEPCTIRVQGVGMEGED